MLIYGIKNKDSGKIVYVGQTTRSLSSRWNQHLRDSKKLQYPLYRAIHKYGVTKFEAFLIEEVKDLEALDKREKELIVEFDTLTPNGYNLMLGQKGGRHSAETVEAIRAAAIRNNFGKWKRTEKHNQANRIRGIDQHDDPVQRINFLIGNGSKEFNVFEAVCIQKRSPSKPSIYEKGKFIGTYLDTTKIAKELGLNSKVITQVLRKEKKAHKGLIFEYKEN